MELSTVKEKLLGVIPNPVINELNIQFHVEEPVYIRVYDPSGVLIYKEVLFEEGQINCQSWSSGTYLINCESEKSVQSFVITKE